MEKQILPSYILLLHITTTGTCSLYFSLCSPVYFFPAISFSRRKSQLKFYTEFNHCTRVNSLPDHIRSGDAPQVKGDFATVTQR
ncbi:hypothetical protein L1987_84480 [Smallanthus sonchifolius]|uniref:Uncharacterized protein n=1 Tax=Smallanthus sonchifolius TaxID=185202 RepID=A0ACB8YF12_9ASTR|nr:hypothetical protein L1987_84480 [Smallanthus sonchifolius]